MWSQIIALSLLTENIVQDSIRLMKETQRRTRRPICSLPGRLTSLQEKGAAAGFGLGVSVRRTSVQHDVVDHIALVFGVIEAEGAAQIFGDVFRFTAVVTRLHMHGEAVPERKQRHG